MNILILEDEIHIARHLANLVQRLIPDATLYKSATLLEAGIYLREREIDLLLLDLNLKDKDGFDLLRELTAQSFHVIIVSAHVEKAIEAFEYGVLDFVPKPFTEQRLRKAFARLQQQQAENGRRVNYFGVRKRNRLEMIPEEEVLYFEAYGHYCKIHLNDGRVAVYDKSLINLQPLLDERYERVHKSYIVKMTAMTSLEIFPGGRYSILLRNGASVPLSRSNYKRLKEEWLK